MERLWYAAGDDQAPWACSLVGVIERCLHKDPSDRFASAAAVLDALRQNASESAAPSAARQWWRYHQWTITGFFSIR